MEPITLPIYNTEGKEIDSLQLDKSVFDGAVNQAAIFQAVCAYRANQRKGLASTKTRGEVSGGGKKPWKQKGTGRARVGSTRSPLWRHGGVIFGPHPRDFSIRLSQKVKRLALKSSLNIKAGENNLMILDSIALAQPKTKEAVRVLSNLKLLPGEAGKQKLLILTDKIDSNLKRAFGNIAFLDIALANETHTYEVMNHRKLIVTKLGLSALVKRLKNE